jgi:hypothetical protein
MAIRGGARGTSDVVALALAVVLAAAIVLLLSHLVPQVADLMMPPPLSGTGS